MQWLQMECIAVQIPYLQALGDIEIAMKVLSDSGAAGDVHPIDRHYRQLGCKMEVLEHSSDTFKVSYEHTSIYIV